jgi:lysozyme
MATNKPSTGKVIGGATVAGILALAALLVKPWEGRELNPYRDIVGVWTVCYGYTGRMSGGTRR